MTTFFCLLFHKAQVFFFFFGCCFPISCDVFFRIFRGMWLSAVWRSPHLVMVAFAHCTFGKKFFISSLISARAPRIASVYGW